MPWRLQGGGAYSFFERAMKERGPGAFTPQVLLIQIRCRFVLVARVCVELAVCFILILSEAGYAAWRYARQDFAVAPGL